MEVDRQEKRRFKNCYLCPIHPNPRLRKYWTKINKAHSKNSS